MRLIGPTGSKVHGDLSREPRSEAPMSLAVEPRGGWESCFPGSLRGREPGGLQTGALFSAWSQTQGRSCDFSQLLNFSILRWLGSSTSCLLWHQQAGQLTVFFCRIMWAAWDVRRPSGPCPCLWDRLLVSRSFRCFPGDFSSTSDHLSLCFVATRFFPESALTLSGCHLHPMVHVLLALGRQGTAAWPHPCSFLVLVGVAPPCIQPVNPPAISLSLDHIASSCPNAVWPLPVPGISLPPEYLCF